MQTTKALVLSAIKYGDTSLIVKAFTASDGLKSYLLRGVLTSKKGKLKPALFQPLTQLELTASHRNKGTLEHIREARVVHAYSSLHTDVVKNGIVLFLAELLSNSIKDEQQDVGLYTYLEYSFRWLDATSETANFHLLFLINLTKYLGFYPDGSNTGGAYFDLLEGTFKTAPNLNPQVTGDAAVLLRRFLGMDFGALSAIRATKPLRLQLLDALVRYFQLHVQGFGKPKSLAVLNAVFQ